MSVGTLLAVNSLSWDSIPLRLFYLCTPHIDILPVWPFLARTAQYIAVVWNQFARCPLQSPLLPTCCEELGLHQYCLDCRRTIPLSSDFVCCRDHTLVSTFSLGFTDPIVFGHEELGPHPLL